MLIRTCMPCDFHEAKEEQEEPVSYCQKENCWSRFSKCVAKEALRRFLEKESLASGLPPPGRARQKNGDSVSR